MTAILTEIINLLVNGLTSYGQGLGQALSNIVGAMFIDSTGTTPVLSTFGGLIVIFAAISLAVGLTTLLFHFLTSLGKNN